MAAGQLQSRALEIAEREDFKINPDNFRVATLGACILLFLKDFISPFISASESNAAPIFTSFLLS